MPIYEYTCQACGHATEAIQKFTDAPLRECPACHKPDLKKRISAGGFQLKGGGWYATESRAAKKPADSSGGEKAGTDTDTAKKTGTCGTGSCGCH